MSIPERCKDTEGKRLPPQTSGSRDLGQGRPVTKGQKVAEVEDQLVVMAVAEVMENPS